MHSSMPVSLPSALTAWLWTVFRESWTREGSCISQHVYKQMLSKIHYAHINWCIRAQAISWRRQPTDSEREKNPQNPNIPESLAEPLAVHSVTGPQAADEDFKATCIQKWTAQEQKLGQMNAYMNAYNFRHLLRSPSLADKEALNVGYQNLLRRNLPLSAGLNWLL